MTMHRMLRRNEIPQCNGILLGQFFLQRTRAVLPARYISNRLNLQVTTDSLFRLIYFHDLSWPHLGVVVIVIVCVLLIASHTTARGG